MKLISVGYGNMVSAEKIVAIIGSNSAPVKRIIQEAKERSMLIDATCGRKCRAVVITESDHVILSALMPETISSRTEMVDPENNDLSNKNIK